MGAWYKTRREWLRLLTLGSWCLVGCQDPQGGVLIVSHFATSTNPVSEVRIAAGPRNEVLLSGSDFTSTGGSAFRETVPVGVPGSGRWPIRVALVDSAVDTLAVVRTELLLEPDHKHFVSLDAVPDRNGWFICVPTQDRSPIRRLDRNPPDTLYINYWSLPPGKFPPVC